MFIFTVYLHFNTRLLITFQIYRVISFTMDENRTIIFKMIYLFSHMTFRIQAHIFCTIENSYRTKVHHIKISHIWTHNTNSIQIMHITEGDSKNYPSDSNFGISLKHTRRSRVCFGLFQSYRGWIILLTPDQVMCIICFIKWVTWILVI